MALNDRIADELLGRAVNLQRFGEGTRLRVLDVLYDLQADVAKKIADTPENKRTTERYARLGVLHKQVSDTIETRHEEAAGAMREQLVEMSKLEGQHTVSTLNKSVGVDVFSTAITPKQYEVLVDKTLVHGSPAADWWSKQTDDLQRNFERETRLGILAGETNDQIVQRIRGRFTGKYVEVITKSGKRRKVPEFAGGIMSANTRQATALVRTATQAVAQETRMRVYQENDDLIKGWSALTTLDGRTCPVCMGRSGGAWGFDGNPLPESTLKTPSPGRPPWHFQCRCQAMPVVRSWSELTGQDLPEFSKGTQASMDGQVPGDMAFEDWFKTKDEKFQKETLGPGRFDLWKAGKIKLADLSDASGKQLTLKELRARTSGANDSLRKGIDLADYWGEGYLPFDMTDGVSPELADAQRVGRIRKTIGEGKAAEKDDRVWYDSLPDETKERVRTAPKVHGYVRDGLALIDNPEMAAEYARLKGLRPDDGEFLVADRKMQVARIAEKWRKAYDSKELFDDTNPRMVSLRKTVLTFTNEEQGLIRGLRGQIAAPIVRNSKIRLKPGETLAVPEGDTRRDHTRIDDAGNELFTPEERTRRLLLRSYADMNAHGIDVEKLAADPEAGATVFDALKAARVERSAEYDENTRDDADAARTKIFENALEHVGGLTPDVDGNVHIGNKSIRLDSGDVGRLRNGPRAARDLFDAADDELLTEMAADGGLLRLTPSVEASRAVRAYAYPSPQAHQKKIYAERGMSEDGGVVFAVSDDSSTWTHEYGHHFEFRSERVRAATNDWLYSRVGDQEPSSIFGYDPSEKFAQGEFWNPYVGKIYRSSLPVAVRGSRSGFSGAQATEVFSMGVQTLKNDTEMRAMAARDPDHLALVWGLLRGF